LIVDRTPPVDSLVAVDRRRRSLRGIRSNLVLPGPVAAGIGATAAPLVP
jgi:hypothetical protein